MGTFADEQVLYNNNPSPTTAVGLAQMRYNQTAIRELPGASAPVIVEITDGAISPTSAFVRVDTEGQAAADELEVISSVLSDTDSLHDGMILYLQAADQDRVVTVRPTVSANGIQTVDGQDVVLSADSWLSLQLRGGVWHEMRDLRFAKMSTSLLYVSPTGSDTNDGRTAATATKTIGRAITLAQSVRPDNPNHAVVIVIAAGTYNETVHVSNRLVLRLDGNVSISELYFDFGASRAFVQSTTNDVRTLTIGYLGIVRAYVFFDEHINVAANGTAQGHNSVIDIVQGSAAIFGGNLTITATSSNARHVFVNAQSLFYHYGDTLRFLGTASGEALTVGNSSNGYIQNATTIAFDCKCSSFAAAYRSSSILFAGTTLNVPSTAMSSSTGFYAVDSSSVTFSCNVTITNSVAADATAVSAVCSSSIRVVPDKTINITSANGRRSVNAIVIQSSSCFHIAKTSTVKVTIGASDVPVVCVNNNGSISSQGTLDITASSAPAFLLFFSGGSAWFAENNTLKFNGTVTNATVNIETNSVLRVHSSATVTGSVTGKRYSVSTGGQINVGGAGANRFPGSEAGTPGAASYGYYG